MLTLRSSEQATQCARDEPCYEQASNGLHGKPDARMTKVQYIPTRINTMGRCLRRYIRACVTGSYK